MNENLKNAQTPPTDSGRIVDTIEAAAGVTGYTVTFLQRLKGNGCPAFKNGRVHIDELEAHCTENSEACDKLERECDEEDGMSSELLRERVRKIRIANDQAEGLVITRAGVAAQAEQLANELKHALSTQLIDLMPGRCAKLTEAELRVEGRRIHDEICTLLNNGVTPWTKSS